jgi:WD40 repeat protein
MKKTFILFVSFLIVSVIFPKDKSEVFIQLGHSSNITSVLLSKDNRYMISSAKDKTIKIWDTAANTLVRTLSGHTSAVNMIALSPDGKYIASVSDDKSVKIWDFEKELFTIPGQSYDNGFVGFSKDGKSLFFCGADTDDTDVWDFQGRKFKTTFNNNYSYKGIAWSQDGKLAALIGVNPAIISPADYSKITDLKTDSPEWLDFSPDSKTVLSSTGYGMEILDAKTGKLLKKITGESSSKALFTRDGKRIVMIDGSENIKIFDLEKNSFIKILKSHENTVTDIYISEDGKRLASSGADLSVKLWDLDTYKLLNSFGSNSYAVNSIAISGDGKFAVTGSDDKQMRMWDLSNAKLSYSFAKNIEEVSGVAISPDQKNVVMNERYMKLFDAESGNLKKTFVNERFYFGAPVTFTSNGKFILTCDRNCDILLIDMISGKEIRKFHGHTDLLKSISLSPDGKYFLSSGYDRTVRLWNMSINSNELFKLTDHTSDVTAAVFSPDGNFAASGSDDGTLIISDTDFEAGFLRPSKKIHTHMISALAYTPDGKKIIVGSFDKTVSVVDAESGRTTDVFSGHQSTIRGLAVSKDGRYVFSSSWDGTTRIWNLETKKEVAMFAGFSDGEWVIITPEGYFNASPNGAKYLTVQIGTNYYTMDNYLETFFRPDLVKLALSGINLKDFSRLDDVGLAPNVIINGCDIKDGEAVVSVRVTDNGGGIGDLRLYLNGSAVALDNNRGLSNKPAGGATVKTFKIRLADGENTIKAVAFNDKNTMQGNSSEKTLEYKPVSVRKPSLYALVIGINEYENENLELQYAVPDARLLSDTLNKVTAPLFDKVQIRLLSKKSETTKDSIMNALLSFKDLNPEDLFVFYIASHGTVSDGEFFLITSNVGSTSTKKLKEEALSQNYVKELIANIPTSKKLIILDTCNSQALGNDIQAALLTRGLSEDTAIKVLSRSVGVTVLCAAKSNQEALEGYKDHGLFTYVLSEGLSGKADYDKDGYVKTFELADYIDNEVPDLAESVFKVAQYPIVSPGGQGFPIGKMK